MLVLLATVALALTALLVLMASRASDPKRIPVARRAVTRRPPGPKPLLYATRPAPTDQQIRVRKLKQGLRSGILFDLRSGPLPSLSEWVSGRIDILATTRAAAC